MRKKLILYFLATYLMAFVLSPTSVLEAKDEKETVSLSQLWKR